MRPARTGHSALLTMKGERLRAALRDIGLSAEEFGALTGVDAIEIQLWLLGHGEPPAWVPGFLAAISVPEARLRAAAIAGHILDEGVPRDRRLN